MIYEIQSEIQNKLIVREAFKSSFKKQIATFENRQQFRFVELSKNSLNIIESEFNKHRKKKCD